MSVTTLLAILVGVVACGAFAIYYALGAILIRLGDIANALADCRDPVPETVSDIRKHVQRMRVPFDWEKELK